MLYARVLTSSIAHGRVKKIDTTKAMNIPGVKAIITCLEDKTIWRSGDRDHERRALPDHVRFFGETIARRRRHNEEDCRASGTGN